MRTKTVITIVYALLAVAVLSGCNYKPPYQRGFDEGYAAGVEAAGGGVSESQSEAEGDDASAKVTRSAMPSLMSSKSEEADESTADGDASDDGETDASAEDVATEDISGSDSTDSEVLGEGLEPSETDASSGGSVGIPDGRIISAEAVNEALYSHPEVIDGLREIYPDTAIFGEFVGDSETNLLHRVDGPHFSELGYDTIVVFDGSMSLQDILDEGFYTKCDCIDN